MCSVLYVHGEAGKWGAGGPLSNVDMMISMCIRRSTFVCSAAGNRGMNGTAETDVVLLVRCRAFCSSGAQKKRESLIDVEVKQERNNKVGYKEICVNKDL